MKTKELIARMLIENTGIHMLDSGMGNGRHWQKNKNKTLADFESEPDVTFDADGVTESKELYPTISVFHFIEKNLKQDIFCTEYNKLPCKDWDSEICGVSTDQEKWLKDNGFKVERSWNTYDGESNLSQVLQGTNLIHGKDDESNYILLQIHGGCDVRGGYTDAKLFRIEDDCYMIEDIYGDIDGVQVDTCYNGHILTNENGESVPITPESVITLSL